jgi:large subunit ribosomal protein L30e
MAKKVETGVVAEIKKLLEQDKLVFGADETLKGLRAGKIKRVFLSSNASPETKASVERFCSINQVDCVEMDQSSEEIGTLCKKPFAVSVIGVSA